jgi:hypothetical protein
VEIGIGAILGHQVVSLRTSAKQFPAAQVGIASSLTLLAMTGGPDFDVSTEYDTQRFDWFNKGVLQLFG